MGAIINYAPLVSVYLTHTQSVLAAVFIMRILSKLEPSEPRRSTADKERYNKQVTGELLEDGCRGPLAGAATLIGWRLMRWKLSIQRLD